MKHLWVAVLLLAAAAVAGAEDDPFAFIPEGGRTMLGALLAANPDLAGQLAEKRPAADWLAMITADKLPGTEAYDEWQARTLADYLGYAGPVDPNALPLDGRDLTLAQCQSCHIVTVVITQARAKQAWLGTLNKPSHVSVPMPAAERDQLADYLTVNAGIPIDAVPPELRAGGASY